MKKRVRKLGTCECLALMCRQFAQSKAYKGAKYTSNQSIARLLIEIRLFVFNVMRDDGKLVCYYKV